MSKRGKGICIAAVLLLVVLIAAAAFIGKAYFRGIGSTTAEIYVDGELIRTIDLSKVKETETFYVGPGDSNEVQVSPDGIGVITANCPDQICVRQGIRSRGPTPIVCLPNRVSIEFTDPSGAGVPDAVSGG